MNTKDDDFIYIFLHIPRTGGTTLRWHIEHNFKEDERLSLYTDSLNILDGDRSKFSRKEYKAMVEKYIKSIPLAKRNNIKIIYGHYAVCGIHKYFNKPCRYLTYFREPKTRILSLYKYLSQEYNKENTLGKSKNRYKESLFLNRKVPPYEEWFKNIQLKDNYISMLSRTDKMLYKLGYLDTINVNLKEILKALRIFYFIGLTENYNRDSLYIYNLLNINKFYKSKNKTQELVISKKSLDELENKRKNSTSVYRIYYISIILNSLFKLKNPEYWKIVKIMNFKRGLILPLTDTSYKLLDTIKSFSFKMQLRSNFYKNVVNIIKSNFKLYGIF
jgi:hypothetical protein